MSLLSRALQAFLAVAKFKTVHGAAKSLHITQTAITQRIKTLEATLKTTLFIRTHRGMLLTPEAEALLRYCYAANELEGEALAKIQGAATESTITIRITGATSIMTSRIIPQCLPIMQMFPKLLLHFDINDSENRLLSLKSAESQLAIIHQQAVAPEMAHKNLQSEKYVLVCTSAWKHRKLSHILKEERIIDFEPEDQMTFNYLKFYDLFDLACHERHFVNRTDSLAAMLSEGFGYGVLTKEFAAKYIKEKKLIMLNKQQIYENHIALAWYKRPSPPTYFQQLISAIY